MIALATRSAPTSGTRTAGALPPPSTVASGASSSTSASTSPSSQAAKNRRAISSRSSRETSKRRLPSSTCRGARGTELVDREARRDGCQVGLRRLRLDARLVVVQERLLHDVLGLGDGAEHPVGDCEEVWPELLVSVHRHRRRNSRSPCDAVTTTGAVPSPG